MNNPFSEIDARLSNIETLLLDLKHKPQPTPPGPVTEPTNTPPPLMNIREAAAFLDLTVPTLYSYVHEGKIPFYKPGKRLYFSPQDLMQWVKTARKKTMAEIEAEAEQYISKKRKEANHD